MTPTIELMFVRPEMHTTVPQYATPGSAAIDLLACIPFERTIRPDEAELFTTGIAMNIGDPSIVAMIHARSGLGAKHGIVLGNGTGIIDSDYQGEVMVCLWNRSNKEYTIQPMERIAQMLFMPVHQARFVTVDGFGVATERGIRGFGSTGREGSIGGRYTPSVVAEYSGQSRNSCAEVQLEPQDWELGCR